MNDIFIVKNITREGPGLLEGVLEQENVSFELVNFDGGATFPNPADYKAVVVLGGPDSANDETDKMTQELL